MLTYADVCRCASSEQGVFTGNVGDRFGSGLALLLHKEREHDSVFVGAPMAGGRLCVSICTFVLARQVNLYG